MKIGDVSYQVVDADTHVVEPADLWTSRLPNSFQDRAPRIRWNDDSETEMWYFGEEAVFPGWLAGHSGWREYAPKAPKTQADVEPATYEAKARLNRMDEYGIHAQVLYPNIALFNSARIMSDSDKRFQNLLIEVYNDWQAEWSSEAPDRLLPMAALPFWDLNATLAEVERCQALGMRGVIFTQNPAAFGLPTIVDRHWDPLWDLLQDAKLPVNFHIGSGDFSSTLFTEGADIGLHATYATSSVNIFQANARTISTLVIGGVCHRFPGLNFVSVESGVGYIPFLLEAMDWQFKNSGVHKEHPEFDLMPSEYFMRQIYACFWFERATLLHAIDQLGSTNFLFETDFPHPTSQTPGPASHALSPDVYALEVLNSLPAADVENLVHGNAARLYHLT
jgi:uncharacterized protein